MRFELIHFVGLGDAGQAPRPIVLAQLKKTVAPAKGRRASHTQLGRGAPDAVRIGHAAQVIEPTALVPQPRQRCAGQPIAGTGAAAAAIALQPVGAAVLVKMVRTASRTSQAPGRGLLDQVDGLVEPGSWQQQADQIANFKGCATGPRDRVRNRNRSAASAPRGNR